VPARREKSAIQQGDMANWCRGKSAAERRSASTGFGFGKKRGKVEMSASSISQIRKHY